MKRRDFFRLGGMLAAMFTASQGVAASRTGAGTADSDNVDFLADGLLLNAEQYAALLMKMVDEGRIKPDMYSNGGVIEELEIKFASLLGKESAIFMPTGTLANHIAIRKLAGDRKRVIVQAESHIYNDSGDCAQALSGLNLVPLGKKAASFSLEDVKEVRRRTEAGRVETGLGCISIESPVRRRMDRMFGWEAMGEISAYARENGIGLHMDGARLFVESVHTGFSPAEYGSRFDTVFTSLWKCFSAGSGAILAGSKSFVEGLYHTRRMFGGGMPAAWPVAAVALEFVDGFQEEYRSALAKAEKLFSLLSNHGSFRIERPDDGTHIFMMKVEGVVPDEFVLRLARAGIRIRGPYKETGTYFLKVNPSLNRRTPEALAASFMGAAAVQEGKSGT